MITVRDVKWWHDRVEEALATAAALTYDGPRAVQLRMAAQYMALAEQQLLIVKDQAEIDLLERRVNRLSSVILAATKV